MVAKIVGPKGNKEGLSFNEEAFVEPGFYLEMLFGGEARAEFIMKTG